MRSSVHPFEVGETACGCDQHHTAPRLVVVTGGPGAGKTALLEVARKELCQHVAFLPEAATILFAGGFPRGPSRPVTLAGQRAIFWVQHELEEAVRAGGSVATALCDRGCLDGLAYWPDHEEAFLASVGATREAVLARYAAVIHLRTPAPQHYNLSNPMRIETAENAQLIDERIEHAWRDHPRRFFVESHDSFVEKTSQALALIRAELPPCCRKHATGGAG
jgi:predicted ATPase